MNTWRYFFMAWKGRPRYEGGSNLTNRARAWVFAKNGWVPNSIADLTQVNSASNPAPPTGNGRIKDGLLGEWWFDEGSGSTVFDKSYGTGTTNLTLSGDYVWKTDATLSDRKYLSMSATTAAAYNLNPIEVLGLEGNASGMTIEAWVRPTNANGANPGPGRILSLSKADQGASNYQNFMMGHGTWSNAGYSADNYHVRFMTGTEVGFDEETIQQFTGNGTSLAQLQHVVTTLNYENGEVVVKTYVDGDLKVTTTRVGVGYPVFGAWDSSYTLKVGYESGLSRVFNGDLFLIAVYDRALSLGEINQNRSEGVVSITDAYLAGSRLFINEEGLGATIPYNKTVDVVVEASGTRNSAINMTVGASSLSGVYGVDFVIDDTTKTILKTETQQSFTLSTSPDLSADIPITFYILNATGGNVINPVGSNIDSFDFTAICNKIVPSNVGFGTFLGGYSYQLPLGNNQIAALGRVELDRVYEEDVVFTVSGGGDTSGTYALKDNLGTWHELPSSAKVSVLAGNIPQSFDVSCKPNSQGVIFPDTEVVTFHVLSASSASNPTITLDAAATAISVSSYNPPVVTGAMPTSADTGCRVNFATLTPYQTAFGGNYTLDDSNVPSTGLVISNVMVSGGTIKIATARPVKFVDCVFSGNLRAHPSNPNYAVESVNSAPSAGYGLEFEYCTFSGMYNGCHIFSAHKRIHRCAFNWMFADFVKFKVYDGETVWSENWFGPDINKKDSALNGNNGMWSYDDLTANGGFLSTTPHSDILQLSNNHQLESLVWIGNNFEAHSDFYDDDTWDPDHGGGNQCNAHIIVRGTNTYLHNFRVEGNWFHGTSNGYFTFVSDDGSWDELNFIVKNNYFGGKGDSYARISTSVPKYAPTTGNYTKVVEGNKWMYHDCETVRLPQEAIDLGTTTQTLNATTLNVNDLLSGVDFIKLVKPGLNSDHRTNWLSRATPEP
jgi:hypothetical protein